jgi:hypothetical protein
LNAMENFGDAHELDFSVQLVSALTAAG